MRLTCDSVNRVHSYFLIARRDAGDADVLVLRFPDGRTALPVFGRQEEAGMFLWLETVGSCASVRQIVYPFSANTLGSAPETVPREDFLQTLSLSQTLSLPDGRHRRTKEANREFVSLASVREKDFW